MHTNFFLDYLPIEHGLFIFVYQIGLTRRQQFLIGTFLKFSGLKNQKNPGKSASGGQSLPDRGFQRCVFYSLNIQERFQTKKVSTPRGLIDLNCDLRIAIFPTFKGLCLPDKTELDQFSDMYELV